MQVQKHNLDDFSPVAGSPVDPILSAYQTMTNWPSVSIRTLREVHLPYHILQLLVKSAQCIIWTPDIESIENVVHLCNKLPNTQDKFPVLSLQRHMKWPK